jgi:hypothetical protein
MAWAWVHWGCPVVTVFGKGSGRVCFKTMRGAAYSPWDRIHRGRKGDAARCPKPIAIKA